jgi:hypothetical protein
MLQIQSTVEVSPLQASGQSSRSQPPSSAQASSTMASVPPRASERPIAGGGTTRQAALAWAVANRGDDGRLPSGKAIADRFGRHERWGRLVKQHLTDGPGNTARSGSAA